MIYAHNAKYEHFMGLIEYIDNPINVINGRIVKAALFHHVIKDSFAIIPVALAKFGGKLKIDYAKHEADVRELHKDEILRYMHRDCTELFRVVTEFHERFGNQNTIAQTAMKQLKKITPYLKLTPEADKTYRQYYFGGRVQCFATGIQAGKWQVYDVNSMYPYVMKNRLHPINGDFNVSRSMPDNFDKPFFAHIRARNRGCLPWRDPARANSELNFNLPEGEFFACSHEIEIGLKYDLLDIDAVYECYTPNETTTFAEFIDTFYDLRNKAREEKDVMGVEFYKLIMNSAYGKFGQDPSKYSDYMIWRNEEPPYMYEKWAEDDYELFSTNPYFQLWAKPARVSKHSYFDVSIAASITSAARATLLEGLQFARNPIYCDTDSLICEALDRPISTKDLGAWKLELECDRVAIGGKKLYALYNADGRPLFPNHDDPEKRLAKTVSKGGSLKLPDILRVCRGETVEFASPVPTFSLAAPPSFITRKFRKTA